MSEMLILNPAPRRKHRKAPSAAQKRAAFASAARSRSHGAKRRRRNPAPVVASARRVIRRKSNPIAAHHARRRRRNPIGASGAAKKLNIKAIMSAMRDAALGGVGAIAVDVGWGKLNPHLPLSMQTKATGIGVGDAVKAVATVSVGLLASKATRGLSQKMAMGALITQMRDVISTMLPASMAVAGMGYHSPAQMVNTTQRVGPMRMTQNSMGAYQRKGGHTPMLNAYQASGGTSALLSGRMSARQREGSIR